MSAPRRLHHIVLMKLKPEATEEQISALDRALLGLKDAIPGIVSLNVGRQNAPDASLPFPSTWSDRSQGFQYVLNVVLESKEALAVYAPHPAHQNAIQNFINPIRLETLVVDYELPY